MKGSDQQHLNAWLPCVSAQQTSVENELLEKAAALLL